MSLPRTARDQILSILSRQAYSMQELHEKLTKKDFPPEEIQDALQWARDHHYINDDDVQAAIFREATRKGRGPHWIHEKLRARGLNPDISEEKDLELSELSSKIALSRIQQKFGDPALLDKRAQSRAWHFLLRQGFEQDVASKLLGLDSSD